MMRALGWRTFVADGLVRLGDVAAAQGDMTEATSLYTEALTSYRQSHRQWGANRSPHITAALSHLAHTALEQGDWARAESHAAESLTVARELGQRGIPEVARTLEVEAALAAVRNAPARALRLAGAAAALRARIVQPLPVSDQATFEQTLILARRALTTEESAAAWAEGQAMSSDEAITDALREDV
jgi:hypothetical protein